MIEVLRIRIQTINGQILSHQETVTNCHTFLSHEEMESLRTAKEMKLQYRASQRHRKDGGDPEHEPKIYVALNYLEK